MSSLWFSPSVVRRHPVFLGRPHRTWLRQEPLHIQRILQVNRTLYIGARYSGEGWRDHGCMDGWMDGWSYFLLLLPLLHSSIPSFHRPLGSELKKCAAYCHRELLPVFHYLDLHRGTTVLLRVWLFRFFWNCHKNQWFVPYFKATSVKLFS